MKKIVTSHICPPIPTRECDWCAYYDGEEEQGGYGYGPTEDAAIADFLSNQDEDVPVNMGEAESIKAPGPIRPMVFLTGPKEGILFDPEGKFHGWMMRQHPDGMWVSTRKLEAVNPEDNPFNALFSLSAQS